MKREKARLNMKLLKQDKDALMKIAHSEGETMSAVIRRLIRMTLEEEEEKRNKTKNQVQD
jgi:hypothetical protein